jgi:hypothetical protein
MGKGPNVAKKTPIGGPRHSQRLGILIAAESMTKSNRDASHAIFSTRGAPRATSSNTRAAPSASPCAKARDHLFSHACCCPTARHDARGLHRKGEHRSGQ